MYHINELALVLGYGAATVILGLGFVAVTLALVRYRR